MVKNMMMTIDRGGQIDESALAKPVVVEREIT